MWKTKLTMTIVTRYLYSDDKVMATDFLDVLYAWL